MPSTVIVRYGELAIKSESVRKRFERILVESIKRALVGLNYKIRIIRGRIFVDTNSTATVIKRLANLPGITSLSPSVRTKAKMQDIRAQAVRSAKKVLREGMAFAVRTNRVGEHPFSSRDVNIDIGASILSAIGGIRVDLSNPDVEVSIDIRDEDAYVFIKTVKGVGGLPVGTQGKVISLFSGTRNDATAAFLMLKRGCKVYLLFLNPQRNLNNPMSKRVVSSARKLARFDPTMVLLSFPFKEILAALHKKSLEKFEFYICRRCELHAAEIVAKRVGAEAIVIGDDAAQIKMQRLANLKVTDEVCKLAVLRPIAGLNDQEIGQTVEKMGMKSFNFNPICRIPSGEVMSLEEIRNMEKEINIYAIFDEASRKIKTVKIG